MSTFTDGQILTASQLNAVVAATVPAGSVVAFGGSSTPANWLLCDGQAVSRSTYAVLFAAIGTGYGAGNGSTTFNVPNLKGRVPVGRDSADTAFDVLGETGGAKTHTLTTSEMPSHTHTQDAHTHIQNSHLHRMANNSTLYQLQAVTGTPSIALSGSGEGVDTQGQIATNQNATATNQNTGGGDAHNILQPYLVLNFIIKT